MLWMTFCRFIPQLGFSEIFENSANFKHLHSVANQPIVDVLHKLRIDLNESGSGAELPQPAAGECSIIYIVYFNNSLLFFF